jgi:1-acyl-sn-glycerol-3-phosphate acyltransferase
MIESFLIGLTRILTGAVVRTRGFSFDPPAQRIYYANHTSHMDTLLVWSLIPRGQRRKVRPVAARDYWWSSSWRRYLAEKVLHAVPVLRVREMALDDPLHDLEAALAQGDSLIFFPEGTRGTGGKIQPFKNGLHHIVAKHPHVTLVPVYIENLNRVLPKGEMLPVPILCTVSFGAGFSLEAGERRADFIARAQAALEALVTT